VILGHAIIIPNKKDPSIEKSFTLLHIRRATVCAIAITAQSGDGLEIVYWLKVMHG
jgi:hypothetical protein